MNKINKETESPVEPIAEAVRGLARDRSYLIKVREAYIEKYGKPIMTCSPKESTEIAVENLRAHTAKNPQSIEILEGDFVSCVDKYNDQIAEIDARIDRLSMLDLKNVRKVEVAQ